MTNISKLNQKKKRLKKSQDPTRGQLRGESHTPLKELTLDLNQNNKTKICITPMKQSDISLM